VVGADTIEVAVIRSGGSGAAGRKRIRVNGLARRASGLAGILRVVVFAPEEMLLIAGSPSLRRGAIDQLAASGSPAYADALSTYGRTLQQRNSLLRQIREEGASRDELRFWDEAFLDSGGAIVAERRRLLDVLAEPLAAAHAEIAPDEAAAAARPAVRHNAPALPRNARARWRGDGVWNGSTLVGPHRDDIAFELGGRDLAGFASRGQQRTAILAFKLAELDILTALDGRPPLLLLDDVFSELDPDRRSHLVRRIAELPQSFVTTTTLDDLDPELRAIATAWEVRLGEAGASLVGAGQPSARSSRQGPRERTPPADDPAGRRPPARPEDESGCPGRSPPRGAELPTQRAPAGDPLGASPSDRSRSSRRSCASAARSC
jgi:DNA replication and repair protein RecF